MNREFIAFKSGRVGPAAAKDKSHVPVMYSSALAGYTLTLRVRASFVVPEETFQFYESCTPVSGEYNKRVLIYS
jgi:hypothetical protein